MAIRIISVVLHMIYNSLYYYFTPFIVNFIPYFVAAPSY